MNKGLLGDGIVDSGVGRTLSSYERPRIRSRSEERTSTIPNGLMSNGFGPMISTKSEPLSEPIIRMYSRKTNSIDYHAKQQNSVLAGIPLPPQSKIFSQYEQYSNCDTNQEIDKHKNDKYRKKEKTENCFESTENGGKLQISPLFTERLQPTRHKTKYTILTILDNGEVCIEFIKRRNGIVCIKNINFNYLLYIIIFFLGKNK